MSVYFLKTGIYRRKQCLEFFLYGKIWFNSRKRDLAGDVLFKSRPPQSACDLVNERLQNALKLTLSIAPDYSIILTKKKT